MTAESRNAAVILPMEINALNRISPWRVMFQSAARMSVGAGRKIGSIHPISETNCHEPRTVKQVPKEISRLVGRLSRPLNAKERESDPSRRAGTDAVELISGAVELVSGARLDTVSAMHLLFVTANRPV